MEPSHAYAIYDAAIDRNDTYVASDAVLDYTTVVQTTTPVFDPVTNQSTTALTIAPPDEQVHIEAGYDVYDRAIVNVYERDTEPDPYLDLADETRTVKSLGAQHSIYDGYGNRLAVTVPDGAPSNSPMEGLAYEGAQVTDGILIDATATDKVYSRGAAMGARFSIVGQPGTAQRIGEDRLRITASLADVASAPAGGALLSQTSGDGEKLTKQEGKITRTYAKQGDKYVLEEVLVESETVTDKATIKEKQRVQFKNVTWHENKEEDKKRKEQREKSKGSVALSVPTAPSFVESCIVDEYGNPCDGSGGGGTGGGTSYTDPCGAVAGGQNIVLQHGLAADSMTWTRMKGWLRCDWQLNKELVPSLAWKDSHSNQSYAQMNRLTNTGQSGFVLIGHSQGGLVSRYTAQRFRSQGKGYMIEGVVSLGTPHRGAILARNMKKGGVNGLYSLLGAAGRCGTRFLDASCHITSYVIKKHWTHG